MQCAIAIHSAAKLYVVHTLRDSGTGARSGLKSGLVATSAGRPASASFTSWGSCMSGREDTDRRPEAERYNARPMRVVGVDGTRKGWLAVCLEDGHFLKAATFRRFEEVVGAFLDASQFAVDIPIGLPDSGPRAADGLARKLVGPQHRSVFDVPRREVVEEWSYERACERLFKLEGRKLSKQSWAIVPKLLEVDQRVGPGDPIVEVHPEVSFRALAGRPLRFGKKTWGGISQRRKLLVAAGIRIPDDISVLGHAAPDDVLDATAAAWTAHRVATRVAQSLPEPPEQDELGRRVAIWF